MDAAWITPENLEPYEENLAKYGSKAKNRKDPSFADALKQAQEPSIADDIIRRSIVGGSTSDDDGSEEEKDGRGENGDESEDVEMKPAGVRDRRAARPNAGGRGGARNGGPRRAGGGGRKRMSFSSNSSGDEAVPETTPKRSRKTDKESHTPENGPSGAGSKQDSDDAQSAAMESPRSGSPGARRSPEHRDHGPSQGARDDGKPSRGTKSHQHKNGGKAYQHLMQLRHKLQKTVIKGPVLEDLSPVHEVLRKLEDFEMTLELIQDTKLGKVMRIIAGTDRLQNAPEEKYDIKGRAGRLAEKWRQLIIKIREESVEPAAAAESPLEKPLEADGRQGDAKPAAAPNGGDAPAAEATRADDNGERSNNGGNADN
ncbi:hypothetical protein GGF46_002359 [Coemansia sp. RSA 552]|nr:hypothetical protein GGF46_002359 [Coemansia sp. RSA 552]